MREDVIVAVENLLKTVTVIKSVSRVSNVDLLSASSFPAVNILDVNPDNLMAKTGNFVDVYLTLDIEIHVQTTNAQSTQLNAVDNAISVAVSANRTLGGKVAYIRMMPSTSSESGGADNIANRVRQIEIFYEGNLAEGI